MNIIIDIDFIKWPTLMCTTNMTKKRNCSLFIATDLSVHTNKVYQKVFFPKQIINNAIS